MKLPAKSAAVMKILSNIGLQNISKQPILAHDSPSITMTLGAGLYNETDLLNRP